MINVLILSFSSESDREKFDLIFKKYKNLMLYKANEILKDQYLAEDAVSDAFLRIYKNMHKISDPLSNQSIAFIVTIVKNTAITLYRKVNKLKDKTVEVEYLENMSDEVYDLETNVISKMATEKIHLIINELNEKSRSVFLLKYANGCSHKEIGKLLDMKEGTVTVTLHRAKKALIKMLVAEGLIQNEGV